MLKTAEYIANNIIIADNNNTTKKYIKKTTGVDLSVKNFYKITSPGYLLNNKTIVGKYELVEKEIFEFETKSFNGWYLNPHTTYICQLNEGCKFGATDTGYIILRSSLNRNGVSLTSAVWDASFTTESDKGIEGMSVRITVDNDQGIYIEENSRVGQLLVFENLASGEQYNGQFQNKGLK